MMEHPSIMSPVHSNRKTGLRLAAIAVAMTLAGCSTMSKLNPFDSDDDEAPPPAARTSTMPSGSSSMDANRSAAAPVAQPQQQIVQQISQPVPLASGAPDEYIVKEGDTLWDIAATFLRDPWYWPEVWYVNPQLENPHLI